MNNVLKIAIATFALTATPALAGHPYANGEANSGGIAKTAVTQGTLHPGHVAVFASGKYNKPAADFHLDGTPYGTGPGGYADTKKNANAKK